MVPFIFSRAISLPLIVLLAGVALAEMLVMRDLAAAASGFFVGYLVPIFLALSMIKPQLGFQENQPAPHASSSSIRFFVVSIPIGVGGLLLALLGKSADSKSTIALGIVVFAASWLAGAYFWISAAWRSLGQSEPKATGRTSFIRFNQWLRSNWFALTAIVATSFCISILASILREFTIAGASLGFAAGIGILRYQIERRILLWGYLVHHVIAIKRIQKALLALVVVLIGLFVGLFLASTAGNKSLATIFLTLSGGVFAAGILLWTIGSGLALIAKEE
jgi:hypothetical protein